MDFSKITVTDTNSQHYQLIFETLEEARSYCENALEKRKFSSEFDLALGFKIKKIEETMRQSALEIDPNSYFDKWGPLLHFGAQTWVGLDFQILQCSYHDLFQIFTAIKMRRLKSNTSRIIIKGNYRKCFLKIYE